ncbi:MAG: hypothetical protein IJW40_01320 [Clostridia bacterium]|nr:hypothetical protein [Clostridia bacterium]
MYKGKKTCKILKEIRAQIAAENDIFYVTSECQHKGDCAGTCPKCEAEVRYLEKELEKRARLGKAVTVAGLAAAITATSLSATACDTFRTTEGELAPDPDSMVTTDGAIALPENDDDIVITDGEPAIPTVYLPEFEQYRHLLHDTDALYDFLVNYCSENGCISAVPTYDVMSVNSWSRSHTEQQEGKYIEYFNVYSYWNPQTQKDEQTVVGLVFTPDEGADPEDIGSYLWTAVVVDTLIVEEATAGDIPVPGGI